MSKLVPKYTIWEAINAALVGVQRAIEEIRTLARIPGPAGPAGRDGVGFDDIDVVEEDEGVMIRFVQGDIVKKFRLPIVRDRGVFKEATKYRKGDGVTWGGSFWIAQGDTTAEKPDSGGGGWRQAVKKGRDGADFDPNKPPKPRGPVKVG